MGLGFLASAANPTPRKHGLWLRSFPSCRKFLELILSSTYMGSTVPADKRTQSIAGKRPQPFSVNLFTSSSLLTQPCHHRLHQLGGCIATCITQRNSYTCRLPQDSLRPFRASNRTGRTVTHRMRRELKEALREPCAAALCKLSH